jgi:hypothetical protein
MPPAGLPPEPPDPRKSNTILKVVGFILLLVVVLIAALSQSELTNDTKGDLELIRGYARMNPLPQDAKEVTVLQPDLSPDGMLGVRFKASEKSIGEWLRISPGTQGVKGEYAEGGFVRYKVPEDKFDPEARSAEVRVHQSDQVVWIAVSPASKSLLDKSRSK